ncbi:MAG TPA: IS5/IS1182 family transposase, partial [Thermoanaerobaculia bacterium]|nr:IS5/IS1182 family transposase [Thermoanaerobaculia bacterium]HWM92642.1 IS5/IS1182 family transposase [Thermoanaerobaculia bacterium]
THAWNERCRRLLIHHDRSSKIAASWIWLAQAGILLRRLA